MPVLRHSPGTEAVEFYGKTLYRPVCGCGWRPKVKDWNLPPAQATAQKQAEQHAETKGCGKVRFASEAEAQQAVLDAKIARGVHGTARRQEERAYLCPDCPGGVWHLSSKPMRRSA
jgi:hypothetical protein